MGAEDHERVDVETPRRPRWWQRLWAWLKTTAPAVTYVQCPACRRWRNDPTEDCPGCGL